MKDKAERKGFTLVELMIVIAIVAILVALALPSYSAYIRKAKRGEAEKLLMNWANVQEIWRANNPEYDDGTNIGIPTHDYYTFSVTGTSASAYILTADPTGDQANDKDRGQACDPLEINQSGARGVDDDNDDSTPPIAICWGD